MRQEAVDGTPWRKRLAVQPLSGLGRRAQGESTLAIAMSADVNDFDGDKVAVRQPGPAHDFPGGTPRFIQHCTGYKQAIVNGKANVPDAERRRADRSGVAPPQMEGA